MVNDLDRPVPDLDATYEDFAAFCRRWRIRELRLDGMLEAPSIPLDQLPAGVTLNIPTGRSLRFESAYRSDSIELFDPAQPDERRDIQDQYEEFNRLCGRKVFLGTLLENRNYIDRYLLEKNAQLIYWEKRNPPLITHPSERPLSSLSSTELVVFGLMLDAVLMKQDIDFIISGIDLDTFRTEAKYRPNVEYQLYYLSDAIAKIDPAFKSSYPQIAWTTLSELREEMSSMSDEKLWNTITDDLPRMCYEVEALIPDEERPVKRKIN